MTDESSTTFDRYDLSTEEKRTHNISKQMVRGRRFIGTYLEKRYVQPVDAYRDVVALFEEETELISDLVHVKNRIQRRYPTNHWVGITERDTVGAPSNTCIWVELPEGTMLGTYVFVIKTIKFNEKETLLRVKVIESNLPRESPKRTTRRGRASSSFKTNEGDAADGNDGAGSFFKEYFSMNKMELLRNSKNAIVFLMVLLGALATGSLQLAMFMCDFLLKFMRETSRIIEALRPVLLACVDMVSRAFAGVLTLIALLWRDRHGQTPIKPPQYILMQPQRPTLKSLPAPYRHGVVITELQ